MNKISYKILRQKDGYQYLRTFRSTENNVCYHVFLDKFGNVYYFRNVKFITTSDLVFIGDSNSEDGISDNAHRHLMGHTSRAV